MISNTQSPVNFFDALYVDTKDITGLPYVSGGRSSRGWSRVTAATDADELSDLESDLLSVPPEKHSWGG